MKTPQFFFLNGDLHQKLAINRGKDLIYMWNYPDHKRVMANYTDTLRRLEPAFNKKHVAKMLNRSVKLIEKVLYSGEIEKPQHSYNLESGRIRQYMWSEKDILEWLEYLSTIHYGRPRHDGMIIPMALPTPREVRALCRDEQIMYVRQGDNYVPTFKAKEF